MVEMIAETNGRIAARHEAHQILACGGSICFMMSGFLEGQIPTLIRTVLERLD